MQSGSTFVLNEATKFAAIQQQFEADKAAALTAEHELRTKKEAECSSAVKV